MGRGISSIPVVFRILIVFSLFLSGSWEFARIRASEPIHVGVGGGTAVDLDGGVVDPLKASAGKVVVLIFVRVDCPISNRYAPTIQKIAHQYVGRANAGRVVFWLVYPDRSESAEQIRKHEREFGYDLPALRDVQRSLVSESRAQTTPEAAVFDANRKLIYHGRIDNLFEDFGRARPAATTHELEDAIRAAIDGKEVADASVPSVGCYISDLK
jgi:thiol-disulfide isomerase/thioredoxin